jgi:hypothetical protein
VHPGVPQAAQDHQPGDVVVVEDPLAAGRPRDAGQQADPFVVAQGVEAEAGLLGDLSGRIGRHTSRFCP